MIRIRSCLLVAMIPFVFAVGKADAGGREYKIDSDNSSVIFKVKNRNTSYVFGRFNKISGTLSANKFRKPTQFKIDVEVEVKSLDTGNNKRDNHVRGSQFLNSRKNPTISFKTISATDVDDDNKFEVTGKLNFFGTSKEITVKCELVGVVEVDRLTRRAGILATFTIKRSDFGMDYMIPEIDDEVTITVSLEGLLKVTPAG